MEKQIGEFRDVASAMMNAANACAVAVDEYQEIAKDVLDSETLDDSLAEYAKGNSSPLEMEFENARERRFGRDAIRSARGDDMRDQEAS